MQPKTTTAFLAIVGRPNVGKSSLMNRLLGQKVAIVSNKPQTTRTRITGVLTEGNCQLVFIDTPGLHRPRTRLGENMVRAVDSSVSDVDVCVLVADASAKGAKDAGFEPPAAEIELMEQFRKKKLPAVLALNKIDLVPGREALLSLIQAYTRRFPFTAVVPLSAKTGDGVPALLSELRAFAQPGPHYFDDTALTDQPERVIAAELIREKMLRLLDKEVPHGTAVSVERFEERKTSAGEDILDIDADIYCESASHKGIIIGKQGAMLKEISTRARQDMERFFGCKVNLSCWVKVREDWRNRRGLLHNFGLD